MFTSFESSRGVRACLEPYISTCTTLTCDETQLVLHQYYIFSCILVCVGNHRRLELMKITPHSTLGRHFFFSTMALEGGGVLLPGSQDDAVQEIPREVWRHANRRQKQKENRKKPQAPPERRYAITDQEIKNIWSDAMGTGGIPLPKVEQSHTYKTRATGRAERAQVRRCRKQTYRTARLTYQTSNRVDSMPEMIEQFQDSLSFQTRNHIPNGPHNHNADAPFSQMESRRMNQAQPPYSPFIPSWNNLNFAAPSNSWQANRPQMHPSRLNQINQNQFSQQPTAVSYPSSCYPSAHAPLQPGPSAIHPFGLPGYPTFTSFTAPQKQPWERRLELIMPKPTAEYMKRCDLKDTEVAMHSQIPCIEPKRLLVIIDLNGTLVLRLNKKARFIERPNVLKFMDYLLEHHSVMIWTSSTSQNVKTILDNLLTTEKCAKLEGVWARDTLRLTKEQFVNKVQVYKQLSWVWESNINTSASPKWDQTNTVLIDDTVAKAKSEPHNLLLIPEYTEREEQGDILGQVLGYLQWLAVQPNVSNAIRTRPFTADGSWTWTWD